MNGKEDSNPSANAEDMPRELLAGPGPPPATALIGRDERKKREAVAEEDE